MTNCIMLVDDDPEILRFCRTVLERRGFVVLEATDGRSALHLLEETTPDLFILDVMMSEMNGVELCERLRAIPQHAQTPVLFLSAWGDPKTIAQTFASGANDYLVKPIDPRDLETKVRELLGAIQEEPRSRHL